MLVDEGRRHDRPWHHTRLQAARLQAARLPQESRPRLAATDQLSVSVEADRLRDLHRHLLSVACLQSETRHGGAALIGSPLEGQTGSPAALAIAAPAPMLDKSSVGTAGRESGNISRPSVDPTSPAGRPTTDQVESEQSVRGEPGCPSPPAVGRGMDVNPCASASDIGGGGGTHG